MSADTVLQEAEITREPKRTLEAAVSKEPSPSFEELAIELGPQLRVYLERMVRNAADAAR